MSQNWILHNYVRDIKLHNNIFEKWRHNLFEKWIQFKHKNLCHIPSLPDHHCLRLRALSVSNINYKILWILLDVDFPLQRYLIFLEEHSSNLQTDKRHFIIFLVVFATLKIQHYHQQPPKIYPLHFYMAASILFFGWECCSLKYCDTDEWIFITFITIQNLFDQSAVATWCCWDYILVNINICIYYKRWAWTLKIVTIIIL